ncbi:MAG: hypothetical protein ABIQ27_02780 [Flavobacterium sp.]|uniref:hypothetical protein n=1 Tax=Flavobacterium sp. TaxID=239 RepID=UPI0032658BAD
MKRQIMFTLSFIVFGFTVNQTFAQEAAAVTKTAGYDLKKNVKCRMASTPEGCSVVFEHVNPLTRETSSGMSTGRRKYEPIRLIKEYRVSATDNSVSEVRSPRDLASGQATGRAAQKAEEIVETTAVASTGLGVGKVSIQDIHFVVSNKDTKRELATTNGECDLPNDLPDGTYTMTASWSWGMSQSGGTSSGGMSSGRSANKGCSVDFLVEIKGGNYMAINEKGLPGDKGPKKSNK